MFKDRIDAGEQLAQELIDFKDHPTAVVVGIPRGGVVPASVIAKKLNLPLDLVLTKKIGHPSNPEYAIGAVSLNGYVLDSNVNLSKKYIKDEIERIRDLLMTRYKSWYGDDRPLDLRNKTVILVDDGAATGNTLVSAARFIKDENPDRIIIAIPVGPAETVEKLKEYSDEVLCLDIHDPFYSIGRHYAEFKQVPDEEVTSYL